MHVILLIKHWWKDHEHTEMSPHPRAYSRIRRTRQRDCYTMSCFIRLYTSPGAMQFEPYSRALEVRLSGWCPRIDGHEPAPVLEYQDCMARGAAGVAFFFFFTNFKANSSCFWFHNLRKYITFPRNCPWRHLRIQTSFSARIVLQAFHQLQGERSQFGLLCEARSHPITLIWEAPDLLKSSSVLRLDSHRLA